MPHAKLTGAVTSPHVRCVQLTPGGVQMPQLALQHSRPDGHHVAPQLTGIGGSALAETDGAGALALGVGAGARGTPASAAAGAV
jgi:hypothetical protein